MFTEAGHGWAGQLCEAHSYLSQVESEGLGRDELPEASELGSDWLVLTSVVLALGLLTSPSAQKSGMEARLVISELSSLAPQLSPVSLATPGRVLSVRAAVAGSS